MIRLQFHYLLSRVSVGFLALSALALTASAVYATRFWDGMAILDGFPAVGRAEYARESIVVARFILVATALFLNIHCFLPGNSRYAAFFLSSPKDRLTFISAKLGMIGLILTALTAHGWLSFSLAGFHLTPFFDWSVEEGEWFAALVAETWTFGLLQAFLMQLSDSVFSGIPTLLLFWWLESSSDAALSSDFSFLFEVIPHLIRTPEGFSRLFEWSSAGILLGALGILNLAIFRFRDVK